MEDFLSDAHRHAERGVWPDERLHNEVIKLADQLRQPYYTGERRAQISRAMARVTFEQGERYVETHPDVELIGEIDTIKPKRKLV